jgi:hypothetical protein
MRAGLLHPRAQILEVLFLGGVWMVVGEGAVNVGEQHFMLAGHFGGEAAQDFPGGAVARVPGDVERRFAVVILQQPSSWIICP